MRLPLPDTLMGRLALVTGLVLLIATGAFLQQSNARLSESIERGELARLRAIAATLALQVDGEEHARAMRLAPDGFDSWDDAPEPLRQIHEELELAVSRNNLNTAAETLVVEDVSRIRAAPDVVAFSALRVVATSSVAPAFRRLADYQPEMYGAIFDGRTTIKRPYADRHGTWISAYAPITDDAGEVVAILAIDTPLDQLLDEADRHTTQLALFALLLLVITLCAMIIAAARMTRALSSLGDAAEDFGSGDFKTAITAPSGSTAEVIQLADALEHSRQQISSHIESRLQSEAQLADALERAEVATRAKSQFLANMSHELRTPMNAIIGYSEMVVEDAQDMGAESLVPDLERIRSAGGHLLALIDDVLDLSKVEAGKMTLNVETFDVPSLVEEVAATLLPLVSKRDNELVIDLGEDIDTMTSDEMRLRQILINLLSNGTKFTEKGTLTLEIRAMGPMIVFRIRDTGIGMSAEQLAKLFQPFVQADASTTREYGGTGLGLALCRDFAELMGGRIFAESLEGRGSVFHVELPRVAKHPADAVAAE